MRELYEKAVLLQNLLVSHATGSHESDQQYQELRELFTRDDRLNPLLPSFVRTCRTVSQFWGFIKQTSPTYAGRRTIIWAAFNNLLQHLEAESSHPADDSVSVVLETLSAETVSEAWKKALLRRSADPEGAITSARSLLESVCKHILDDNCVPYAEGLELPKLYKEASKALRLSPSQHTEAIFKQILGGCTSVVEGLGAVRNRLSDSHGSGRRPVTPAPRHAELAVNLAGAMAQFLVATAAEKNGK